MAEEICLLVQVETAEALREVEAIAAVQGIDGIFIDPQGTEKIALQFGNT